MRTSGKLSEFEGEACFLNTPGAAFKTAIRIIYKEYCGAPAGRAATFKTAIQPS